MLFLSLALARPPSIPAELVWRAHTTSQVDRMDVTAHEVTEVVEHRRAVPEGLEIVQEPRLIERVVQSSFGRLNAEQLAKLPDPPRLRMVLDRKGNVVDVEGRDRRVNDLITAVGTQVQLSPVPRVKAGRSWSRSQVVDVEVPGPDGSLVPLRLAIDVDGTREDVEGPEQHRLALTLRLVGGGRKVAVGRTSGAACVRVHPDDRLPLAVALQMRSMVIVGADDRGPTTVWIRQRLERLNAGAVPTPSCRAAD